MKLLTYAVSQKLNNNNDMWRFVKENQPIPINVVESAFAETLENYTDIRAERLVSSYTDFITHHIPVTFIPNEHGVQVSGEIQDEALEVIESFYSQTSDDVIRETIESSIHTISPERDIEITDIETMASVLHTNVLENHKRVVNLNTFETFDETKHVDTHQKISENVRKPQDIQIVDESPAKTIIEARQTPLDKATQALVEAEQKEADNDVFDIPALELDEPSIDDIVLDDPVEETVEVTDESTETGLVASVWNHFIKSIKEHDLDKRLNLETPTNLAVL